MTDHTNGLYDGKSDGDFSVVTKSPPAPVRPSSARSWGSGRNLDPFLGGDFSDGEKPPFRETGSTEEELSPVDSPTLPTMENSHEDDKSRQDHDGKPDAEKRTIRERLSITREKIGETREKVSSRIARKTEPARRTVAEAHKEVDPRNFTSRRWSFLWATAASWLIGPQFLVALWDRAMILCGQKTLMSGPEAMGFGVLHGPGRWFRDTVGQHWTSGSMSHLLVCAAFGIVPLLLMAAANTWGQYARWLLGTAVLGPAVYLTGVSYAGWALTAEDFYLVALFASAWYCTVWLREKKDPGFTRFLLMIPLASVVSGTLLYSPGAVW